MRPVDPNRRSPSLPGMLLLGAVLIIASVIRLAAAAAVRAIAPGRADKD